MYANDVALPVFACHTPRCCAQCSNRSISPVSQATVANLHQQHVAVGWDRQMDIIPFHKPCSAYYTGSANKNNRKIIQQFVTSARGDA